MTISVNWVTKVITVPKADLTLVSGTLYEHDTDAFLREVRAAEASSAGISYPKIIDHNSAYTVVGVTYAQKIEIVNGYSVEYENGLYSVRLINSNNNIFDIQGGILFQNNVQVIPGNSAGLQVITTGSGVTAQDKADIISGTKNAILGAESYP